jgi:hypothetical protein
VSYVTADLLAPQAEWSGGFDFVLEIYTLQVLPAAMRSAAIARLGELVAPGGALLVIARGRDEDESAGEQVPWKLARSEFQPLIDVGLVESSFNNFFDNEDPPVRRFRAVYTRPPTPSR